MASEKDTFCTDETAVCILVRSEGFSDKVGHQRVRAATEARNFKHIKDYIDSEQHTDIRLKDAQNGLSCPNVHRCYLVYKNGHCSG